MDKETLSGQASPVTIRTILHQDPIWSAYALADLQPAFVPHCRWFCADTASGPGLVLLYSGLRPTVLMTSGSAAGVQSALARTPLPDRVYLSVQEAHLPGVDRFYGGRDRRPMWRMVLRQPLALPASPIEPLQRLTKADADRLAALYAHGGDFTPDAFDPYQLANGVFYAIENETGALAAAGGTHIVNRSEGVAAIGNVYTRPDCRRRGYARAITAAVAATLQRQGIGTTVLNVDQRNVAARSLYEQLGFAIHCPFWEGVAVKRAP